MTKTIYMYFRFLLVIVSIFFYSISFSQKKIEHYYNYYGHECPVDDARFYSLEIKTDSGWYKTDYFVSIKKLQTVGLYEDQEDLMPNGTFYWFYFNGALESVGKYIHGKKSGIWMDYFPDRTLKDSANYEDGHPIGISLGWYKNGASRDSLNVDSNGNGVYISWFDNGNPSSAGRYTDFNKQQGKWQYFHKNGRMSSLEIYHLDTLIDKNYFDEDGNPMSDTTSNDRDVQFVGGEKAWNKYFDKNVYFPSGYEFKNGYQAIVTVTATVNEDGKVIDYQVSLPLNPAFDKAALGLFDNSPLWEPAISHNRKVYGTVSRSINFSVSTNLY
jgi:antitoxin component YwqK of YwqJK toxin-antitoxin module